MKKQLLSILIIFYFLNSTKASEKLSAEDIINKSIEFSGGIVNIKKIYTTEYVYTYKELDSSFASIVIKRRQSKGYVRSVLSMTHYPQTIYYNSKILSLVEGAKVLHKKNIDEIDEIKLQTYDVIQYAYKELKYKLERLEDQKFINFDCYVVKTTSENGYSLLNYLDKTNFRLIMIIYPKGNKSLFKNYEFKENVLFHTHIINVDKNLKQSTLELKNIKLNNPVSESWFNVPFEKDVILPPNIKEGIFKPVFGTPVILTRDSKVQSEVYNEGKSELKLFLMWFNDYTIVLVNSESKNAEGNLKPGEGILVKIISWDDKGYVCHYLSKGQAGTQEYIRIR